MEHLRHWPLSPLSGVPRSSWWEEGSDGEVHDGPSLRHLHRPSHLVSTSRILPPQQSRTGEIFDLWCRTGVAELNMKSWRCFFTIGVNRGKNWFGNEMGSWYEATIKICRRSRPSKWRWRWPSRDTPWVWCFIYFILFEMILHPCLIDFFGCFGCFLACNQSIIILPNCSRSTRSRHRVEN